MQYKIDSFIFFFMSMFIQILTQGSFMADVLKQNVERLKELYTNITSRLLTQDVQEEGKHILLQEKAECTNTCQINFIAFLFYSIINFCFRNECNWIELSRGRTFFTVCYCLITLQGNWIAIIQLSNLTENWKEKNTLLHNP